MKTSSREVCPRRPDIIPRLKSGKARIATGEILRFQSRRSSRQEVG
jgi:hypothetical protein